jgi:uncharacterized protein YcgI (DUF1989 family)
LSGAWNNPLRIVTIDGPQVGDFNVWNADDPRARL